MNYIGKFVTTFRDFYNDLNPATLSGAIDVVIVEQEDGTFACSPFHIRFGKRGVFSRREKIVDITINGEPVELQMKLGETGEAFFVQPGEIEDDTTTNSLASSPLQDSYFPPGMTSAVPTHPTELPPDSPPSAAASVSPVQHLPPPPVQPPLQPEKTTLVVQPSVSSESTREKTVRRQSESPESPERGRHESGNDSDKTSLSPEAKKQQQSRSRKRRRARLRKQKDEDDIFKMDLTDDDSREATPEVPDGSGHDSLIRTSSLPHIPDISEEGPMDTTVESSGQDPYHLPSRRLSNSLSFLQISSEAPHVTFAPSFSSRAIPSDNHTAKSEGQLTPPKATALSEDVISGCMSDSEIDRKKSETKKIREDDGAHVTWQWGELPTPKKGTTDTMTSPLPGSVENIAEATVSGNSNEPPKSSYLRGMFSFIRRPKPILTKSASEAIVTSTARQNQEESGKYLSDLATQDISHSQKEKYLALDTLTTQKFRQRPDREGKVPSAIQPVSFQNVPDMAVPMPALVEVEGKSIELVPLAAQERAKAIDALSQDAKSSAYSSMASSPPLSDTDSEKTTERGTKYRKTLRLSSDQIKTLPLQMGLNEAEFCIVTKYQGSATCKCNIFLWRYDDKIVISDIDGTITKSDVLGHILPVIGSTWAQAGVAGLYNRVSNNGYKFLYLSSRAIGQANFTRDHLRSIIQENVTLPDGPLLLSPKSLFLAFHQEVIIKRPEEFKIACLNDIRALFPPGRNPFFAAYGNKTTDLIAYLSVGVSKNRIFTINYQGQLKHEVLRQAQSSYSQQSTLVDMVFPPLRVLSTRNELISELEAADEFGSFSFWREPLPDLEKTHLLPPPEPELVSGKSVKGKSKAETSRASPTRETGKSQRK